MRRHAPQGRARYDSRSRKEGIDQRLDEQAPWLEACSLRSSPSRELTASGRPALAEV